MITTINEWMQHNENAHYDKLIGKKLDLYNRGVVTILGYGERLDLYKKFNVQVPHNPMGYHIPTGTYLAVKDENNQVNILNPGAIKKALDVLNNSAPVEAAYKLVTDLSSLKLNDIIYYKVSDNQYIKGQIGDDFGDGKFLVMDKPIRIDGSYERHFELFPGEFPEIESKLYTL